MGFIDFHAHLHPTEEARLRLLSKMSELHFPKAVVVAGGVVSPGGLSENITGTLEKNLPVPNQEILNLCSKSDGRLIPFYFANPHADTYEYQALGHLFHGLKLGPAVHGVSLTDFRHDNYLRIALTHQHPVYLHCLDRPGFNTEALLTIARKFPALRFILGHAGIGNCDFSSVDQISEQANIFFETSGGFSSVISYAVKKLGIDRILFGSEYPLQDPESEWVKIKNLGINELDLNRNANHLLGVSI